MTVDAALVDAFVEGFRERIAASRRPGQQVLDEPGIVALTGRSADLLDGRALVTDDRAAGVLRACLPELNARVLNVFAGATECSGLVAGDGGHRSQPTTAMVHDDLGTIPDLGLPEGLHLRPVSRPPTDDGVSLEDAARCAVRSDPGAAPTGDLDAFVA